MDFGSEELTRAQYFVAAANDIYSLEERHVDGLHEMARAVHAQVLTQKMFEFKSQTLKANGAVRAARTSNGFETVSVITEVRNEIGEGDCDPIAQAECAYVAIYSSDEVRGSRPSRVPTLTLQC